MTYPLRFMRDWIYYAIHECLLWYADKSPTVRLQEWWKSIYHETTDSWILVKTQMTLEAFDREAEKMMPRGGVDEPVLTVKPSEVEGLDDIRLSAPWSSEYSDRKI